MVKKKGGEGRVQGRAVPRKLFSSSFTRCSRRSFLYLDGVLDDGRDGVVFLLALRRLRRYLFVYLISKFLRSCFNAFRRALFALSVFYAILLYFQLFRKFFRRVFRFFLFYSGAENQRARNKRLKHNTQSGHTGEQEPSGPGHRTRNTTNHAGAPVSRSQVAQHTADAKQRTQQAHR